MIWGLLGVLAVLFKALVSGSRVGGNDEGSDWAACDGWDTT